MSARKRNYLYTLSRIFSLLLLFSGFAGAASAAGSDATGWSISGADSITEPFDLGGGDVTAGTQWRPGIEVYGSGRAVKNGGSVKTDIYNTHAIKVAGAGSSLDLTGVSVQTLDEISYGLYTDNGGTITMNGGSVEILANNQHSGYNAPPSYAIYADRASAITLNGVGISTNMGLENHAVIANAGSTVKLYGGSVYTGGFNSVAMYASGDKSAIYAERVEIETAGAYAYGVLVDRTVSQNSATVSIDKSKITTHGDEASAIHIENANELFLTDTQITTNGKNSRGLVAAFGAKAYLENVDIAVNNPDGIWTMALNIQYGSNVTLKNGSFSAPNAMHTAIRAVGSSAYSQTKVIGLEGVYSILGGMYAAGNSLIDITMDNGSLFRGWTNYTSNDAATVLNLGLNGSDTVWEVAADSNLTNLYMDGATVDMSYSNLGSEMFVVNLGESASDNGIFRMEADIVDGKADHLTVKGTARGAYILDVLNRGDDATTGDEITDLVFVEAGQTAAFTLDHIVELGGWRYELHGPDIDNPGETPPLDPRGVHTDNAWYLFGTGRSSTPGSGAVNSFAGSYLMAYADTQTLIQRMGDLRQSLYGQGLWFRVHGGKFESNSRSYVRGFDMDYGGVQIGYDRKLESKLNGTLYTGVMFGYGKGDLDYGHEGSGEVDSKTLGVYGTYIARNGWYVDAILKYQWMTNDFDVIDTAGTLVKGQEVETGGFGASVEIGKRIHVGKGKQDKQGWYVEPQVQLSYQHQDGGYFNSTSGLRVGVDSFGSLLGRVGMLVGYETEKTNLYAKISRVKEFDGDLTIRANGVPISESFEDDWWVYGIGCTSRISDRNSLYCEIERTSGGSFSQPWRVFAGWRVEF